MRNIFMVFALIFLLSVGANAYENRVPVFYQSEWIVVESAESDEVRPERTGVTAYTFDSTSGEFIASGRSITFREGDIGVLYQIESGRLYQIVVLRDGSWTRSVCIVECIGGFDP